MNTKPVNRLVYFFGALTLWMSGPANLQGDDMQSLFRFFGHGWGKGYHASPQRFGCGSSKPIWTQQTYACPDRYSRHPFLGCMDENNGTPGGCGQNGNPYGNAIVPYTNSGIQSVPYSHYPQTEYIPSVNYRASPPTVGQPLPHAVSPQTHSIYRNQASPLPREPRTTNETFDFQLPEIESSGAEDLQPLEDIENTGTKTNPFGVSPRQSIAPRESQPRLSARPQMTIDYRNQSMSHLSSAPQPPRSVTGKYVPAVPSRIPRQFQPVPSSNTFNGIR